MLHDATAQDSAVVAAMPTCKLAVVHKKVLFHLKHASARQKVIY